MPKIVVYSLDMTHLLYVCSLFIILISSNAFAANLPNPQLVSPAAKSVSGKEVNFSWKPVSGAKRYLLSVTKATDIYFKSPVHVQKYTTLLAKVSLADGDYRWRIRAENDTQTSAWSLKIVFTVKAASTTAPASEPVPAPAPVVSSFVNTRAMWAWHSDDIATLDKQNILLNFAKDKGITVLTIHAEGMVKNSSSELASFIDLASKQNIAVELLFGAPTWTFADKHADVLSLVSKANAYVNSLTGAKPVGLHFDVEPHSLPEWQTDPINMGNQLVDLYIKIRQEALPSLYINADIAMGYSGKELTRNGVTRSLSHWMVEVTDRLTLMAYRDYALGSDSITSHSSHPMERAKALGKVVVVGVETMCDLELGKITFCEEGEAAMEKELDEVKRYFEDNKAFGGVSVHHYRSYNELKP